MNNIRLVLVDDDFSIRYVLKSILKFKNLKIFTSDNGVEGVGFTLITSPQIIILDTTLPKYSGLEILDFLKTNKKFNENRPPILVLNEGEKIDNLPEHYIVLNKSTNTFLQELLTHLGIIINSINNDLLTKDKIVISKPNRLFKAKLYLGQKVIKWANLSDKILHKNFSFFNIFRNIQWFGSQIIASFYLFLYSLLTGKLLETNIDQSKTDALKYRVRVYPTMMTVLVSFLVITSQLALFILGGAVILDTHVNSVFAAGHNVYQLDLAKSQRMHVSLTNNSLVLEENNIVSSDNLLKTPTSALVSATTTQTKTLSKNVILNPSSTPLPINPTVEVNRGLITFIQKVLFDSIYAILENSSLNTYSSSTAVPTNKTSPTSITYQLSPDLKNWYYISNGIWSLAYKASNSNTVQEINQYLPLYSQYSKNVGSGKVFIRVFLTSDNKTTLKINSISVNTEVKVVSQ